jgi:hypothetical protein
MYGPTPTATEVEDQVKQAYAQGKPAEAIAAWFGISVEQVQHIVSGEITVPPAAQKSRRKRNLIIGAAALLVLLTAAGAVLAWWLSARDEKQTQQAAQAAQRARLAVFQDAKNACGASEAGLQVTDGGTTLIFDGYGSEDYAGAQSTVLSCVLLQLHTPDAVISHMSSTSALNGRQEDSWEGFTASWTYHPDNGLDVIIRTV